MESKNLVRARRTTTAVEPVTRKHRMQVRMLLGISHPAQRQQAQQYSSATLNPCAIQTRGSKSR